MASFPCVVAARHSISAPPESVSRDTTSPTSQLALRPAPGGVRNSSYLRGRGSATRPDLHSSPKQIAAQVDRMSSCSRSKTKLNFGQPRKEDRPLCMKTCLAGQSGNLQANRDSGWDTSLLPNAYICSPAYIIKVSSTHDNGQAGPAKAVAQ